MRGRSRRDGKLLGVRGDMRSAMGFATVRDLGWLGATLWIVGAGLGLVGGWLFLGGSGRV